LVIAPITLAWFSGDSENCASDFDIETRGKVDRTVPAAADTRLCETTDRPFPVWSRLPPRRFERLLPAGSGH
jgi:hypothetical protein